MNDANGQMSEIGVSLFPQDWHDVWTLWGDLPIVRLRYPLYGTLAKTGCTISKWLQGAIWRSTLCMEHAGGGQFCINGGDQIQCLRSSDGCKANRAYPLNLIKGESKKSHQMASVYVRPQADGNLLDVLIIGPLEPSLVLEINQVLQEFLGGLVGPVVPHYATFAELCPIQSGRHSFLCVTPWIAAFGPVATELRKHRQTLTQFFEFKLKESLAQHGYKFSAMALDLHPHSHELTLSERQAICTQGRNVGRDSLDQGLKLEACPLTDRKLSIPSKSNGNLIPCGVLEGSFELDIDTSAWPWIALMQLAGGGNMTDEGWGAVACYSNGVCLT